MMVLGRLLCGLAGAYHMIIVQYNSEIAEKEIRGSLGSLKQLAYVQKNLFCYILGVFTNVFWLSFICGSIIQRVLTISS